MRDQGEATANKQNLFLQFIPLPLWSLTRQQVSSSRMGLCIHACACVSTHVYMCVHRDVCICVFFYMQICSLTAT